MTPVEVLAAHWTYAYRNSDGEDVLECDCGALFALASDHARHLLGELAEAGHRVVPAGGEA